MVEVRPITTAATLPLRGKVLRPHLPLAEAINPGDDDATTVHFGCFVRGAITAVASIYLDPPPAALKEVLAARFGSEALVRPWRLRGMAAEPASQGRGYGRAALEACISHASQQGGTLLWCNARVGALGFYKRSGFLSFGEKFEIPGAGDHFVMARIIP